MTNKTMAVGDIKSQEKGSAARDNEGKPQWALMPLELLYSFRFNPPPPQEELSTIFLSIARFQEDPTHQRAFNIASDILSIYQAKSGRNMWSCLERTVRVWEYGLTKYSAWNWAKGQNWSHPLNSMLRHLIAFDSGELLDPESVCGHLAHAMCNAMMLVHFTKYYPEGNDIPSKWFQEQ